jgi:class 3 adenylate cyclase/predicted ATPase
MDVAEWLRALGLEQYQAAFREHEISPAVLPNLSADDLKELGVAAVGHRRRLLDEISLLCASSGSDRARSPGEPRDLEQPTAERRQVSVMFCDIADSTAISTQLDPEDLSAVIRGYQSLVAATIARFGGFIARYVGDGVLTYFGWPEAREADAERSVRAALAIISAIGRAPIHGQSLRLRIGIATGLVVIGTPIGSGDARQQTAIGETPNLAARVQGLAGINGVAIDETTRRLLGGLFDCRDLGRHELKGFPDPVPVWLVLSEAGIASRFEAFHTGALTPLIGRDGELALLEWCWRQAARGEGQAIFVSGEAGIGKSRLIAAFERLVEDDAPTRLRYFCSADQTDTALHPVITALRHEANFSRGDTDAERLTKLHALLASTMSPTEDIALIADLLSIPQPDRPPILDASPRIRKERTLAALVTRLRWLGRANAVLVILEDAHWADASSIEFFNAMIPALMDLPVLLVISTRNDDTRTRIGGEAIRTLTLPRLTRRHSAALASSIMAGATLPPALLNRIVAQTDGIPLFVEELTKTVLETASLDGADPIPHTVPISLQTSLLARLDRIPDAKALAQIGAVLGREFSHTLLMAIADLPESAVLHGLEQLLNSGLATRGGSPPEANYAFKHALVRDTAYGMMLRSRRRELHARAANALEKQAPELREQQPELLAHHFTQAGLAEPAITYWTSAGRRSIARSAMVEAVAQLRQALELVPELPEGATRHRKELELQSMLGGTIFTLQSWAGGRASQALTRAHELAEQLGDIEAMMVMLAGLVTYHIGQCQFRDAREIATKLLAIAEGEGTPGIQLVAHRCMGVVMHWTGEFAGALEHFDRVLALYDPAQHGQLATIVGFDVGIQAAFLSCWDLLVLGYPDRALARFELAVARLGEVNHRHTLVFALGYGGIFSLFLQDNERAFRQLSEASELASEQHFAAWIGICAVVLGSVFTARDDGARGLAQARDGYAKYEASTGASDTDTPLVLNSTYYLALLAHASEAAGIFAEARSYLDAAIDVAERSGECWFEPELHRLKGEWFLCHNVGEETQAEAAFMVAIERAARRNALFWELRASVSLAKLLVTLHRPGRARDVLAPVYQRFTEGLDWPDLREAERLLASLSP